MSNDAFSILKDGVCSIDPKFWIEKYLTLDGKPFSMTNNGYKPFVDIYRYIGVKALELDAKPVVIVAGRQVGKDLSIRTPVPTPRGWTTMEYLQVGDKVYDEYGEPCTVKYVSEVFTDHPCYRITFSDMTTVIAGEDHQWSVHTMDARCKNLPATIVTTKDLFENLVVKHNDIEVWNYSILDKLILPVNVYVYEARNFRFIVNVERVPTVPTKCIAVDSESNLFLITYARIATHNTTLAGALSLYFTCSKQFGTNDKSPMRVMHLFPLLGHADSYSKMKLNPMIQNSVTIDTTVIKNKSPKTYIQSLFDTTSKTHDSLRLKEFINGNHLAIDSTGLDAGRIRGRQLALDTELPTPNGFVKLIDVKEGDELFDEKGNVCHVTKVHPINLTPEAYEITFSDGTIVEACAEHLWQVYTDCDRIEENKPRIRNTKQILENIYDQHSVATLISGNIKHIFIKKIVPIESKPMRCITVDSPSHLYLITRSYIPTHNTADIQFFDEVQDIPREAIGNATKILTTAKYGPKGSGVQIYFGTPKRHGSDFYRMWQVSSQQYYQLGCLSCHKHFPLYTPGSDEWESIWIKEYIVQCTHCGFQQDKRESAEIGKWVGVNDGDYKYIGFHINQLYNPELTKEKILENKPQNNPISTEKTYFNEVLGEFYKGDSSPITDEEIRTICGDVERKFRPQISVGEEHIVTLGIDYGLKADMDQLVNPDKSNGSGQSYTTAVVLVCKNNNLLHIEYALKFSKNDTEGKRSIIESLMRKYSINLAVGDIGFSQDFSSDLHVSYGDRYLVSRAAGGKLLQTAKFNEEAFPKEIYFDRDHYLGEMFEKLKKGHIRFPLGDYEKIAWLINHCSSMELKPIISRTGEPTMHYVKGGTPNDGLMSLVNAYLAYKFIVTDKFNVNNPTLQKSVTSKVKFPISLGVIKRNL